MNLLHRQLIIGLLVTFAVVSPAFAFEKEMSQRQSSLANILRQPDMTYSNLRRLIDERATSAITTTAAPANIIYDQFTGANNSALIGRLAGTNLPGLGYAGNGNVSSLGGITGGTPYEADIQSNAARLGADAGLAINLNSTAALLMQLSISFNISGDTETQSENAHRGAGLGFFSSVSVASGGSSHGFNNFTGLVVDRTGTIRLIISGADSGIFTTANSFDANATHTIAYNINITLGVGTISNILLDGTAVNLSAPVSSFTAARTIYSGFYNSSGSGTDVATFDNFLLAPVPEPTVLTLIALGLVTLPRLLSRARHVNPPGCREELIATKRVESQAQDRLAASPG